MGKNLFITQYSFSYNNSTAKQKIRTYINGSNILVRMCYSSSKLCSTRKNYSSLNPNGINSLFHK